jgi:hypothetical protein
MEFEGQRPYPSKKREGSFEAAKEEKKIMGEGMGREDLFYRNFSIEEVAERGVDVEGRKVDLSFSSEIQLQRWFGIEILSHKPEAIIKGRLHTMLFHHMAPNIVGPVKKITYDNGKGHAEGHFDKTPEGDLRFIQVQSGSLKGVSVGYFVKKFKKLAPGEEYELAGGKIKAPSEKEEAERGPIYIAEKWGPGEISLTPTPADHTVGIGRESTRSLDGIEIDEPKTNPDLEGDRHSEEKGGKKEMDEKELQAKIEEAIRAKDTENKGILKKVFDRASAIGLEGLAFRLLTEGKSPEEITDAIILKVSEQRGKPGDSKDPDPEKKPLLNSIDDDTLARALSEPVLMNLA